MAQEALAGAYGVSRRYRRRAPSCAEAPSRVIIHPIQPGSARFRRMRRGRIGRPGPLEPALLVGTRRGRGGYRLATTGGTRPANVVAHQSKKSTPPGSGGGATNNNPAPL